MKTKNILRILLVIAIIFSAGFAFSTFDSKAMGTTCSLTFCGTDGSGTPLAGHDLEFFYNGTSIGHCTTGANGCCSPSIQFEHGKTYCVCDLSDPCTNNCTSFTVNCLTVPTINFHLCGGNCQ